MLLIGYPFAGVASKHGATRYSLIRQGLRIGLGQGHSDITGKQGTGAGAGRLVHDELGKVLVHTSTGRGASAQYRLVRKGKGKRARVVRVLVSKSNAARGAVLGKRARSVGRGIDQDTARALDLEQWLAPLLPLSDKPDKARASARARILSEIGAEQSMGDRLLAIGARAARRQGQRLVELRGVKPSDTSLADAAADAVSGVLSCVRALDKARGDLWHGCGADRCACDKCKGHARFIRVLAMFAGRAAFKSLCSWARVGMTGDNTQTPSHWCEIVTDALDTLASEGQKQDDQVWFSESQRARRAVVRWVFQVGLRDYAATIPEGKGKGRAIGAARSRCRVVGSVVFGASLVDACAQSGFTCVKAWVESCKGAGFFNALREARRRNLGSCVSLDMAIGLQRAFAIDAGQAARDLRALNGRGAWRDSFHTDTQRARGIRGARSVQSILARRAVLSDLRVAIDGAQFHKARAARLVRDNMRAFDQVLAGLHSDRFGDLRQLFGLIDKRGRARSRGINPQGIARARGKVNRAPKLPPVVPVKIESRGAVRKLSCVPSVALQSWRSEGDQAFVIVKARD